MYVISLWMYFNLVMDVLYLPKIAVKIGFNPNSERIKH
jgi:hypothetical protein